MYNNLTEETMGRKRNSFSASLKAKVALEAIKEEKTINELSEIYKAHPNMIRAWKKEFLDNMETLFVDKRKTKKKDSEVDPDELFKKIGKLQLHNDWLKKKLGIDD